MDLKLKFSLSQEDYKKFFGHHYKTYTIGRWRPIYGAIMIIIGISLFLYSSGENIFLTSYLLVAFGIYFLFTKYFYVKKMTKNATTNPDFGSEILLEFSDTSLLFEDKGSQGKMNYGSIFGINEVDEGIMLYLQKNSFIPIPNRAFKSVEQKRKILEILSSNSQNLM